MASTLVHKARAGELALGPLRDLDRALGDVEFDANWRPTGWLLPSRWGRELFQSQRFRQRYVERWREHRRAAALDSAELEVIIGETEQELAAAAARHERSRP